MKSRSSGIMVGSLLGISGFCIAYFYVIMNSGGSTSAIGLIFMPIVAVIGAIAGAIFGPATLYLVRWYRETPRSWTPQLSGALVVLLVPGFFIGQGVFWRIQIERVRMFPSERLGEMVRSGWFGRDPYVLSAMTERKDLSPTVLHEIASIRDEALHRRFGSISSVIFGYDGENKKGLAVQRLVARHPNVSAETLTLLGDSPDDYVLGDVAANPKTSVAVLRKILSKKSEMIRWGAALNRNAPRDVLVELAADRSEYTRANVAENPGAATELLATLSGDPNWNVRRSVAGNDRTPVVVLEKLLKDPDSRVRYSAELMLKKLQERSLSNE